MIAPNEFWLYLHRLAEAYDAEGLSSHERNENIVAQFLEMPLVAQRHVLSDLVLISTQLPDLYPLIVAAMNKIDTEHRQPARGRAG
jgi:hypothetical protein